MAIFNMFGEHEHRTFNYKPIYYDKQKETLRKLTETETKEYVPGQNIKGSFTSGERYRSHGSKFQNIVGIIGLILIFVILFYIAKFYTIL